MQAAKREVLAQKEAKEKETHDAEAAAISVGEEAGAAVARAQCFKPDGKYQSWVSAVHCARTIDWTEPKQKLNSIKRVSFCVFPTVPCECTCVSCSSSQRQ